VYDRERQTGSSSGQDRHLGIGSRRDPLHEHAIEFLGWDLPGNGGNHRSPARQIRPECHRKIFAFPNGRGSSTSSAILLECIRAGTAPAAIINSQVDSTMALGSIVADELYGKSVPVFLLSEEDFAGLCDGHFAHIHPDGRIDISSQRTDPNGSQ
jgi:predicted aconitase with swiveling domain